MHKYTCPTLFILVAALGAGCGDGQDLPTDALAQEELNDNGLSLNGLSWNGLSLNGLSLNGLSWNGLSLNGLSLNGLSTGEFSAWFLGQGDGPAYSDMVMKYMVRCAAPAGTTLSATLNGVAYSWDGRLGLAPQWTAGNPIPVVEQQLITACLAAHVNRFRVHVEFSMSGYKSDGAAIPRVGHEFKDYAIKEGCFFGNLFNGEGIFVGNDSVWGPDKSSLRSCAITVAGKPNNNCPPMTFAGKCTDLCTLDGTKMAYSSCAYSGKSYAVVNTRIAQEDTYKCGDNICQISESCGTGKTPDNCKDCSPCR